MIIFNTLSITEGKNLNIKVAVTDLEYYKDITLKKITICTEGQISETNPEDYGEDFVYQKELSGKEYADTLCAELFNEKYTEHSLSGHMFFIFIECQGTPAANTPCGMDNMTTLGVIFDSEILYKIAMNYTKELANTCIIPQYFKDFILKYNAFKFALNTGHYLVAIKFFKDLINSATSPITKPCGCHG